MQNRQAVLAVIALVVLLVAGGLWFMQQEPEPVATPAAVAKKPKPAKTPADGAATPAPAAAAESDVVALKEEELDKLKVETEELAARAADLEEQVRDGEMIVELKAKQIEKLEAELKQLQSETPPKSK